MGEMQFKPRKNRYAEILSVKIRATQRDFLEAQATAKKTSLCGVARELIDEAMVRAGAEKCQ